MSLSDLISLLRRQIVPVVGGVLLGLALAFTAAMTVPKTYEAHTTLYFTAVDARDAAALSQGAQFVQSQIRSYPLLVTSPEVLTAVAREVGGQESDLAHRVTSEVPTDSTLLAITASGESPEAAATLADSFARHFTTQIQRIETRPGARQSPIRATTVVPATAPSKAVAPDVRIYLILGAGAGLLLGLLIAVAREFLRRS